MKRQATREGIARPLTKTKETLKAKPKFVVCSTEKPEFYSYLNSKISVKELLRQLLDFYDKMVANKTIIQGIRRLQNSIHLHTKKAFFSNQ